MSEPIPVGSDVSAGTYRCTNCGNEMSVQSVTSMPPCSNCEGPYGWQTIRGGDAREDPYPESS
jgi:Zinc-ribbon containing domain